MRAFSFSSSRRYLILKKILIAALLWPLLALAQSYPSPTYQNLTVLGTFTAPAPTFSTPLAVSSGGTGHATASGASLDAITGFASTGFISRTGAGAYSFTASTGSGNVVLGTSPSIAMPTVTGSFTATGLVTTADLATQAANTILANGTGSTASPTAISVPSCSAATNALQWTSGTGFACNSAINAATLGGATFASPGTIGGTTPGAATFTNLTANGTNVIAGYGPFLSNVSALQAATAATLPQSQVHLNGYSSAGDGGGGVFALGTTTTANGCTIFNDASGRSWYRVQNTAEAVNVKWCGATGNGSTNDYSAINSAISLAESYSTPGSVYLPTGVYILNTALNVTAGITIYGDGPQNTYIRPSSTIQAITVSTASGFTLKQLYINYTTAQSSGLYAVTVTAPSGANSFSTFRDVWISGAYSGIQTAESAFTLVDRCFIENFSGYGIQISDAQDIDVGDSSIINSTFFNFSTYVGTGTAIQYLSAGGLRVINNKIGATSVGLNFSYATNVGSSAPNTAQLLVIGNSFDTMTSSAIGISRQTNTDTFNSVVISDNVFPDCFTGVSIPNDANGNWLSGVTISGNVFITPTTASAVGVSVSSTTNFSINNNSFINNSTTGTAITLGSSTVSGDITHNNLGSPPVAWGTTIFNGGGSSLRIADNPGYNPVGATSFTPGGSPWTFTAGASPETVYLSATTSVTSVTSGGHNLLPVSTGANVPVTIELGPNETVLIYYTGTLTDNVYVH